MEKMSFDHLPRIYTVDKRIVESESFFRIEEAEARAAASRDALERRIAAKLRRREKSKKEGSGSSPEKMGLLPEVVPPQFFSAHVLTKDPEAAKYLDYTEVVFPKPYNVLAGSEMGTVQPDFIDKVWISGFLDRSNRDAIAIARQEALKRSKRVGKRAAVAYEDVSSVASSAHPSLADGGDDESTLQPGQGKGKGKGKGNNKGGGGGSVHSDPNSVSNLQKFQPLRDGMAHIGDQATTLSQDISNLESSADARSVASFRSSISSAKAQFYSDIEAAEKVRERAAEARKRAQEARQREKKHITHMMKPYADSVTDYLIRKQTGNWLPQRKSGEEGAGSGAGANGEGAGAGAGGDEPVFGSFLSVDLDRIFDKERREHEAAQTMHKWWKKFKRLVPWRFAIKCMLAAARIQRMVRGAVDFELGWLARGGGRRSVQLEVLHGHALAQVHAGVLAQIAAFDVGLARVFLSERPTKKRPALEVSLAVEGTWADFRHEESKGRKCLGAVERGGPENVEASCGIDLVRDRIGREVRNQSPRCHSCCRCAKHTELGWAARRSVARRQTSFIHIPDLEVVQRIKQRNIAGVLHVVDECFADAQGR